MYVRCMLRLAVLSCLDHGTSQSKLSTPNELFFTFCRTAKVWKNFILAYELKGHQQSVWAVLGVDEDQFLTGENSLFCLDTETDTVDE